MDKPVTVEIPRPLYRQNTELDCMSVLQYMIDSVFGETLTGAQLERIGTWFKSRCDDTARGRG